MTVIHDVQVSFDVHLAHGETEVIPYVVSAKDTTLGNDLKVFNTGASGSSNIAQSRAVSVGAGQRKPVSTISVTPQPGGKCEVNLTLPRQNKHVVRRQIGFWF